MSVASQYLLEMIPVAEARLEEKPIGKGNKIVILTSKNTKSESGLFRTAKRIVSICKDKKIKCYPLFVESGSIRKDGNIHIVSNYDDDEKGFEVSSKDTVVMVRGSVTKQKATLDILSQLERAGIFCVNFRECLETCSDKYRTTLKLADMNILTPKTYLIQSIETLEKTLSEFDEYPVIVKTITGSKGVGVFLIESKRSLKSILQSIWKLSEDAEFIIQTYIKTDNDLRVHVLNGEVIAAMKRHVVPDDFRANYSQNGKASKIKLTDEQISLSILSAKAVGAFWCGVDIIPDGKKNYVIEVNSSPGTEGIEETSGIDVVGMVIDKAIERKNWKYVPIMAGYREVFNIEDIGPVECKLDIGNTNRSVLHADSFKAEGKSVLFERHGKKFRYPLKEFINVNVRGFRDYTEKRPVITLNVSFNDEYVSEDFTLDNRSGRSDMLASRYLLKRLKLAVDSSNKFILTDRSMLNDKKK